MSVRERTRVEVVLVLVLTYGIVKVLKSNYGNYNTFQSNLDLENFRFKILLYYCHSLKTQSLPIVMISLKQFSSVVLICCLMLLGGSVKAHAPNQSYIFLKVYKDSIGGFYEITTNDLNKVFPYNIKNDVSLEDLDSLLPIFEAYILDHLSMASASGGHPILLRNPKIVKSESLGDFLQYEFLLKNVKEIPDELKIRYDGVFEADPTHRGLQVVAYNWKAGILDNEAMVSLTFSPNNTEDVLDLNDASVMKGFISMIKSGTHHIWIGIDHILFLLALLLPGVIRRVKAEPTESAVKRNLLNRVLKPETIVPVEKFKSAFLYVLMIVTFFTISHTITLSLAALNIINLPSRLVESIIAFSIALAAFHNIRPIFKKEWMIAFIFGLFHGFGFASVLGDVGLTGEFLTLSLLGFNIGIELGQIAIMALAFPVLFLLRKTKIYPYILVGGSLLLIAISLYWFIERAFEVDIPLGKILLGY